MVIGSPLSLSEVAPSMANNTVRLVPLAKDRHLRRLISEALGPNEANGMVTSGVAIASDAGGVVRAPPPAAARRPRPSATARLFGAAPLRAVT